MASRMKRQLRTQTRNENAELWSEHAPGIIHREKRKHGVYSTFYLKWERPDYVPDKFSLFPVFIDFLGDHGHYELLHSTTSYYEHSRWRTIVFGVLENRCVFTYAGFKANQAVDTPDLQPITVAAHWDRFFEDERYAAYEEVVEYTYLGDLSTGRYDRAELRRYHKEVDFDELSQRIHKSKRGEDASCVSRRLCETDSKGNLISFQRMHGYDG